MLEDEDDFPMKKPWSLPEYERLRVAVSRLIRTTKLHDARTGESWPLSRFDPAAWARVADFLEINPPDWNELHLAASREPADPPQFRARRA